jgi:RimJ/RimL family protein N-acetyltransferase
VSEPIATARLLLVPVARETAQAVLSGELGGLRVADGWPHEDSLDGLRLAVEHDATCWFVTHDGVVIGDCGTHGPPDDRGNVEIGYGLAPPARGSGFGTELVAGLCHWLLEQPEVVRVVAREVEVDNVPSRRALERAGFVVERTDERCVWYALAR